MANFPNTVVDFLRAKDPETAADLADIKAYQDILESGSQTAFADAQAKLASITNGIQMNLNAGRFNEVLGEIEAIEEFYYDLNGVKSYIQNNIDKFLNIAVWSSLINYSQGNVCSSGGNLYICQIPNIDEEPNPSTNVGDGKTWGYFVKNQKQYIVSPTRPSGLAIGDLWFEEVLD